MGYLVIEWLALESIFFCRIYIGDISTFENIHEKVKVYYIMQKKAIDL
jgi:hypothetical protein